MDDVEWKYMIISPTMIQTEREEMTEAEKAIEAIRELASQNGSQRRVMERLESENREFKSTIEMLRAELSAEAKAAEDLVREVAKLKDKISALTSNNGTLSRAVVHWRDAHRELTKINGDQAEIIERLKCELGKEKARVPPILSDVAALTKEITELKRQLASVRQARDNQAETIRRQQDEISKFSDEINERCTEIDDLTNRNGELKSTLRAYHDSTIKLAEWVQQVGKEDPRRIIMGGRMYTGLTIHDCVEKLKPAKAKDPGAAPAPELSVPFDVVDAINDIDDLTVSSALRKIVSFLLGVDKASSERTDEMMSHHREDISAFCEKIRERIYIVEERLDQ